MWLRALKLSSYIETFAKNEISGSVLLDLGQSDLDYMQIHALGHRKVIMREIERLKRGKSSVDLRQGGTISPSPPRGGKRLLTVSDSSSDIRASKTSSSSSTSTSSPNHTDRRFRFAATTDDKETSETSPQQRQRQEQRRRGGRGSPTSAEGKTSSPSTQQKHWSHVKPLAENVVTGNGTVPVNLADGNYDEARQQSLFQQAVNEWRTPGSSSSSSSSSSSTATATSSSVGGLSAGGSMWNNPLGSLGGSGGEAEGKKSEKGPSLSEGELDVAAEQAKFQQAVLEWRTGGSVVEQATTKSSSSTTSSTTSDAAASTSSTGYESKVDDTAATTAAVDDATTTTTAAASPSSSVRTTGRSKFDGTLNEADEHEKFRRAVKDWRDGNGGKGGAATSPGGRSTAKANDLLKKMDADDQIRREKFQRQKVALEMEMERERDQLSRRREEAAAKLAASKYADDGDDDVGGKKGEADGNDGSLTSRKQYRKWEDVAGIEIEY